MPRALVLSLVFFAACATWRSTGTDATDGGSADGGASDADTESADGSTTKDAGGAKDGGAKSDAGTSNDAGAGTDAGGTTDSGAGTDAGSGIDPALALPSASGAACSTPGSENGCPLASVCRIASPSGGRCESCTNCGHLNDPCTASDECDIVFACFRGHCTNFCHLGTYECGPITSCIDVGHPTIGMCIP